MLVRLGTAAAVLVSAAVHLKLWFDVFHAEDVVGPAFLLNAFGGLVIAVLLLTWRHWVPPLLAAGFGASTLGAFVIATTVGLFGVHEHWAGVYVWVAAASEVIALVGGLVLLAREMSAHRTSAVQSEHRLSLGRLHFH
jgi:hypothetical protein